MLLALKVVNVDPLNKVTQFQGTQSLEDMEFCNRNIDRLVIGSDKEKDQDDRIWKFRG